MRFYEYESRQILQREGVPVANGGFATDAEAAKAIAADRGSSARPMRPHVPARTMAP